MKLLGTIVNGRVELDAPTDLPDGTRMVSLQVEDWEDEEDFDHPIPPATETWDEHIAELRRRIVEKEAGVPGLTVEELFASVRAELTKPGSDL